MRLDTVCVVLRLLLTDLVVDKIDFIIIADELTTLQESKRNAAKDLDGLMINSNDRHKRERECGDDFELGLYLV